MACFILENLARISVGLYFKLVDVFGSVNTLIKFLNIRAYYAKPKTRKRLQGDFANISEKNHLKPILEYTGKFFIKPISISTTKLFEYCSSKQKKPSILWIGIEEFARLQNTPKIP